MRTIFRVASGTIFGAALLLGANITGTVTIERKLTKRKVTSEAALYQRGIAVELGATGEKEPLEWERSHVAVYLEAAPNLSEAAEQASSPAYISQKDRRFEPDFVVIPAGATVSFPNFDPVFHNVFALSKTKSFDLGNYPKGQTRTVHFPTPGIVFVNCHLHPNMGASIVVAPTPWAAVVDSNGRFTLPSVPPGHYMLVAWHKTAGFYRKGVDVTAGNDTRVDFFIPLPAAPPTVAASR
jgi:plastocyanin